MPASYRIAIVGSGPAGLSAAARAARLGLSHILLEKAEDLADTIRKYQKGKHVMATPAQLVLRSDVEFKAGSREEILAAWARNAREHGINVRPKADVRSISGSRGAFRIALADGETIDAETVILAIGTQGNPNRLRCSGADLPHIQYQLDDPGEYIDEHIVVVGSGDAGIENALGLAADAEQGNVVTILNRSETFARAKSANVSLLDEAREAGRIAVLTETSPAGVEPGWMTLDTRDGPQRIRCDRIVARTGSVPPRAFVESCGVEFASPDPESFPRLSPSFETSVPGLYVIGALAGYPLIKHCMNQGHDVVELINGNADLKPADEPILEARFAGLPGRRRVAEWLDFLRSNVAILEPLSPLQMREFMLDSEVRHYRAGTTVFERRDPGDSLFAVASGSVLVEVSAADRSKTVAIGAGSIFGEVGLISGRRRGATIRTAEDSILVEVPRMAALKLMAAVPAARRAIERISTERQILQVFGSGLTSLDVAEILKSARVESVKAGQAILTEAEEGRDVFIINRGSAVVEKAIAGRSVFLSYLPAGSYVGEMALIDGGRRTATVRAAIKSEVIRLDGNAFARLLERKPELLARAKADMAARRQVNAFVEAKKDRFEGAVDLYSSVASFLVENGIGEATDVLLIDEKLCVGCDNCEKACADSHEGLSRLDREAGKTYAHLHVPTSCRHCEHPHCMADCPPDAIHRGADGEVFIDDSCIGCGNCQRNCPYGVIRMEKVPPKKPPLLAWLLAGIGPGPGEPPKKWTEKRVAPETPKRAVKCDMCAGISGGPACVRACPTGAAIRVAPEDMLTVARLGR